MASNGEQQRADLDSIPSDFSLLYYADRVISLKAKQQGFRFFSEGYFSNVQVFLVDENVVSVRGKCYRSQRKNEKPHCVNFDISGKEICYAYCSCQAGLSGSCSHVIGLITAIHQWQLMGFTSIPEEVACTSQPQIWHAPRGPKIDPEPVSNIRFVNPKMERKRAPVQNKITDCRKIRVKEDDVTFLKSLSGCAIGYLVSKPHMTVNTHLGVVPIGSTLATQAQFYVDEVDHPITTHCGDLKFPKPAVVELQDCGDTQTMTVEECYKLEERTRDQADSTVWVQERKHRLTSSQFGLIMKRKKVSEKFIKMLMDPKQFTAKATTYGKSNEKKALMEYTAKTGNHWHKCGLIVSPKFSFLGASPDGKVCVGDGKCGLVEVKCPFSARDKTIREGIALKDFCLTETDGQITLRKEHNYYHQVQGQLLISGADFCDFVVYTKKDIFIQRIEADKDFCSSLLASLFKFYHSYCIDYK